MPSTGRWMHFVILVQKLVLKSLIQKNLIQHDWSIAWWLS